jgi:peptide ABC transporter, permease protein
MNETAAAVRPSRWKEIWEIALRNKLTLTGFIIVGLVVLVGLLAPVLAPYDPNLMDIPARLQGPSSAHPFGTDEMGRDILSRVMYGARISIAVGVIIVAVSAAIGVVLGSLSGYFGGKIDQAVMAVTDMILAFPSMVLALALTAAMGPGLLNTMLAVIIVRIPMYTRLMRGQVLVQKEQQYVRAARTFGEKPFWIVARHIVPNCLTPLMVQMTLGIGDAILIASSMSFIGLGAQPPTPEWGAMISTARVYAIDQWWYAAFPGLSILITIMGFNLIGDGIRDILDPRSRK